jgi:hypothetical protein
MIGAAPEHGNRLLTKSRSVTNEKQEEGGQWIFYPMKKRLIRHSVYDFYDGEEL